MSWTDGVLEDLIQLQRGFDITKAQQKPGNIPVISSSGPQSFHSEAKAKGPGVVIGRKGSLGTVYYSDGDYWPHDTTLWSKDLKGNNPKYVAYFLQTMNLARFDTGNSNPTLNRNHIHGQPIRIPDLPTQERIAGVLSAYDDLIENNRRRIALLEQAARLLYREWFVHFRFPGSETAKFVDGLPEGWKITTYGQVFDFLGGFAFKSSTYTPDGRYGVVTIKNVQNGHFVRECPSRVDDIPAKVKEHCRLKTGDVLLSLTGNVGRSCLVVGDDYLLNQRVAKVTGKDVVPNAFCYWTFSNEDTIKTLENLAYGVAQLNLSPVKLSERPFVRPAPEILEEYNKHASAMMEQIINIEKVTGELRKARDLLLPRLMDGRLPIPE